jgi:hypothetical protein
MIGTRARIGSRRRPVQSASAAGPEQAGQRLLAWCEQPGVVDRVRALALDRKPAQLQQIRGARQRVLQRLVGLVEGDGLALGNLPRLGDRPGETVGMELALESEIELLEDRNLEIERRRQAETREMVDRRRRLDRLARGAEQRRRIDRPAARPARRQRRRRGGSRIGTGGAWRLVHGRTGLQTGRRSAF